MNTTLDQEFAFEAKALFQKTPLGVGEIKSRALGLGPKTRQLLIVIDGHKNCQDLLRIMPQAELVEQIKLLANAALIERLDTAEHFVAPNGNATVGNLGASHFAPTFAPTQAQQTLLDPVVDIQTARSKISHALLDTMGPHGETLASRVEKASDFQEIRELLAAIAPAVEAFGGRNALQAFVQRVGKIF
jgi:hypothetical protein